MAHLQRKLDNDERIMTMLERAMNCPVAERRAFVETACEGDATLLADVWKYVEAEERLGEFLKEPLFAPPPDVKGVLHYEVNGVLGEGGQARVYRAWDKNLKRQVALKFLPPHLKAGSTQHERFLREATSVSALDHPNIGTIFAIEETPAGLFIVMPCYEGENLRDRIHRGRLSPSEAIALALQTARGLAAAHDAGVLHRDLKPSNLILTRQGLVKIIDFGVAKVQGDAKLTESGMRIGTPSYMSPEQSMGLPVDHRSDLWSLGVVLFEMLTGAPPFDTIHAIVNERPPAMPGVNPTLQKVVHKLVAKQPSERYESAAAAIQALESVSTPPQAPTVTLALSKSKSLQLLSRRTIGAAATALVVAMLSFVAWQKWTAIARPPNYLAVLPFKAESNDPAEQALASGMAQAIADALAGYEKSNTSLLVVPASDLQAQKVTDVSSARKALSIEKVLTGEWSHQNGQVHLSLTLVDAAREKAAGSVGIDESDERLPVVLSRAVSEVAAMLRLATPKDASVKTPDHALAGWLRGMGFLERYNPRDIDAGIAELESALQAGPDAVLFAALSKAYRYRHEFSNDPKSLEQARTYATKAVDLDKTLATAYLSRGWIRNTQKDYRGAIEDFEQARVLGVTGNEPLSGLARAFEGIGLNDRAEDTYRQAIAQQPGYWAAYNQLGVFYNRQQRYGDAVPQFRKVLRLNPTNAAAYTNLGSALSLSGQVVEARRVLEQGNKVVPTLAGYNNLGNLLLRAEAYPEAVQAFEKALEIDRTNYKVWANLAAAYFRMPSQQDRSTDAYRQAAALADKARSWYPNDPVILSDLANYYIILGKRAEPLGLLATALALAPGDVRVVVNAAESYEKLGFREQAVVWILKALELGYPVSRIEQNPMMAELRQDPRVGAKMSGSK